MLLQTRSALSIQPGPHGSIEGTASSSARRGLLLQTRSALIDLPTIALFNPSMEGKYSSSSSSSYSSSENCPVPLGQNSDRTRTECGNSAGPSVEVPTSDPNGNYTNPRQTFLLEAWSADFHPMCAHVCRLSPNVCTRLPTLTQCVHTSADSHPMCAHVCRLSPNVCTRLPTLTQCVHTVGVDHSRNIQPGPLGSIEGTASSSARRGLLLQTRSALSIQPGPHGSIE